ncbi:hypothetical protein QL285_062063 [Trifolium repens]|nr:hypothetical protein QL285_062063 [Trifolium repens]
MSTSPFYLQLLLLVKKFASFTLIKVDSLPFHGRGSTIPAHEPGFKTCLCLLVSILLSSTLSHPLGAKNQIFYTQFFSLHKGSIA